MTRRTQYRVAGSSLLVETRDRWSADAIDALFDAWYVTAAADPVGETSRPAFVVRSEGPRTVIPCGLETFAVAGDATCHTDRTTSYLEIDGSVVTIAPADRGGIEVAIDRPLPLDSPALTRLVTCALSAALRQRRRFELHAGAVVEPGSGSGILIVGASGCGKSTLTVNLAAAGWPFLTDDVLLLGRTPTLTAWPLRRSFAITPQTFAASAYLQSRAPLDDAPMVDGKQAFVPHEVFAAGFRASCTPAVILFPELTGALHSLAVRLPPGEAMARLTRISPWASDDRTAAAEHLSVLGVLATQARAWALCAGRDLLDPLAAADVVAECVTAAHEAA
jgi:hypothetical protein